MLRKSVEAKNRLLLLCLHFFICRMLVVTFKAILVLYIYNKYFLNNFIVHVLRFSTCSLKHIRVILFSKLQLLFKNSIHVESMFPCQTRCKDRISGFQTLLQLLGDDKVWHRITMSINSSFIFCHHKVIIYQSL